MKSISGAPTQQSVMSCRWVFLEEVKIVPGVFDGLLLISVHRIHGIFQSISDCFLGGFNFVQ